ncbi:MAG TPA: phosphonate C-P lyase system protein PhnG [Pseudolabrys sp.]|nr:phosphonate C-P lyase system protein PhnG [Pseudolabrys sp.]
MTVADNDGSGTGAGATAERRAAMALLAQATASDIARGLAAIGDGIAFKELRVPETGLVMLRGRIGGDGAPFNAGEATVTRAAVQLASGEKGFAYVLGRDLEKARLAALCDALWQAPTHRPQIERHVLAPLRAAQDERRVLARAQTAATRVDFFTLVRGEDER